MLLLLDVRQNTMIEHVAMCVTKQFDETVTRNGYTNTFDETVPSAISGTLLEHEWNTTFTLELR